MNTDVITRVEIERRIIDVTNALEGRTEDYERMCHRAAVCEADYRGNHARAMLSIAHSSDRKMTVDERMAHTDVATEEEHRMFLIAVAARNSCKESLMSLRSQLDALRSLCANVRIQS